MTLGTAVVAAFALLLLDLIVYTARGGLECDPCDIPTETAGALIFPLGLAAAALLVAFAVKAVTRR